MRLAESFLRSGKVRDLYDIDPDTLLLVASDRLSAFDVVLPTVIPDKGRVLTGLSRFWFAETTAIVANHLRSTSPDDLPAGSIVTESLDATSGLVTRDAVPAGSSDLRGRIMICRRVRVLPVEVIVRGYLAGSGWLDYKQARAISGVSLPTGLHQADRLPAPIFTPSTKAEIGTHDQNITFDEMIDRLVPIADDLEMAGALAERVRSIALALYGYGAAVAARAGILLADTKFEFGLAGSGELLLIDEVMTPDSSRFWSAADYEPGRAQPSYDKQFVRDWLEAQPWNKTAPGPELPAEIVAGTRERYVEAYERITGASFTRYLEEDVIAR
ncbi:MAG TPA: phosphoribosylaminoimidazolesuccinocarboxamide synthase [Candidatus Limnocylindrales bacterium]|jgi:phosphoribosylaminoimidazole-succinocarboxamide synthase